MGVKVQFVRKGLQENRFPFGWAVQTGSTGQWTYWIGKAAFEKWKAEEDAKKGEDK